MMASVRHLVRWTILAATLAPPALAADRPGADAAMHADAPAAGQQIVVGEGSPDALYALGNAYMLGRGVRQDLATAETLFARSARMGNTRAADAYGLLVFQRGDHAAAMPYVEAAARRGDPRAQYLLGVAHFNGDVVAKDWVRAYALVSLARQHGFEAAQSALEQMDRYLSSEQRRQGADLATRIAGGEAPVRPAAAEPAPTPAAVRAPSPPRYSPPGKPPAPSRGQGQWRVQLGVFRDAGNADALWATVRGRPELSGHARIDLSGTTTTALQAGGFASAADAQAACRKLIAAGFACLATR